MSAVTEGDWKRLFLSELIESVVLAGALRLLSNLNSFHHAGITVEGGNPLSASTEEDSLKKAFRNIALSKSFLDYTKCSSAVCTEGKSIKDKYFHFQIKQLIYQVLSRVSSFRYNSSFN